MATSIRAETITKEQRSRNDVSNVSEVSEEENIREIVDLKATSPRKQPCRSFIFDINESRS